MVPTKAMSEFKFSCPVCGQHLQAGMEYIGQRLQCPACGTEFPVPDPRLHTTLHTEHERWVPPPAHAHGAPVSPTVRLPRPGAAPPGPVRPLCGPAVASVILSLSGLLLGPVGAIPGIVCGYAAKASLTRHPLRRGAEWAQAGIRLGYVVLGLWLLAALLFWRLHRH